MTPLVAPVKPVRIELSESLPEISGLDRYRTLQVLICLHGSPLGCVLLPVKSGGCAAAAIRKAILDNLSGAFVRHFVEDALGAPNGKGPLPLVTVAVCSRDNAATLDLCLKSVTGIDYPRLDLLVIDNAPSSSATEVLVRSKYPGLRYIREPRPGLDWARNRAIAEAKGEIIAYADDDVVIDPRWVRALSRPFVEDPEVMAVTGLVAPYEFETDSQVLFELRGGFGKGFQRKWYRSEQTRHIAWRYGGAGQYGTGANMAFRRALFERIGHFDPALDGGTVARGGGDLDIFFRVVKEGFLLVYEPAAMVFHRHRRTHQALRRQMSDWGIGFFSYLVKNAGAYPDERLHFFRLGLWWFWESGVLRLLRSLIRPPVIPRDLIVAEAAGGLLGLFKYRRAESAAGTQGRQGRGGRARVATSATSPTSAAAPTSQRTAIRFVDLTRPLTALTDVADCNSVRVYAGWKGLLLGSVDICNGFAAISAMHLRDRLAGELASRLSDTPLCSLSQGSEVWRQLTEEAEGRWTRLRGLPAKVPVSVVIPTQDSPEDLRQCLLSLMSQESKRELEVIVVDNHPSSGLTPGAVNDFPNVRLIREPRKGFALHSGVAQSHGAIIIAIDDQVVVSRDWLERLVAPFSRPEVMAVTGNILPLELETRAQRMFEAYGGPGRGFRRIELGQEWFRPSPRGPANWEWGETANAAFRSSLRDEALGGNGYLFYRVLKAGGIVVYEPDAYAWRRHGREMSAFHRQLFGCGRGRVVHHLKTLFRDGDFRALLRLGFEMPVSAIRRIKACLLGASDYPLHLVWLEALGALLGPFSLLWSLLRARPRPFTGRGRQRRTNGRRC